jgi:hypothetical protein
VPERYEEDEFRNRSTPVDDPLRLPDPVVPPPAPAAAPPPRGWNNINLSSRPQVNSQQFRGFNDDRALSGGDPNSQKDNFRRFIGGQSGPADTSKQGLDDWLTALIPSARADGLNILDVNGDLALIETKERGPEWIDYFQNAGGEDGAFQWLDQASMAGGAQPDAAFGAALGGLRGAPGGNDVLAQLLQGGQQGPDLLAQIQAELQKLLTGGSEPQGLLQPEAAPAPLF